MHEELVHRLRREQRGGERLPRHERTGMRVASHRAGRPGRGAEVELQQIQHERVVHGVRQVGAEGAEHRERPVLLGLLQRDPERLLHHQLAHPVFGHRPERHGRNRFPVRGRPGACCSRDYGKCRCFLKIPCMVMPMNAGGDEGLRAAPEIVQSEPGFSAAPRKIQVPLPQGRAEARPSHWALRGEGRASARPRGKSPRHYEQRRRDSDTALTAPGKTNSD